MSKNIRKVKEKYHSWVNHIYLVPSFTCNPSGLENCLHNGNARTNYMHCLMKLTVSPLSMPIVTNGLTQLKESG